MGGSLPRRKLRKCRKGEKNCIRFPNALAKEMIKNAARKLMGSYSSKKPLISGGLRLVWNDAKKTNRGNGKGVRKRKVNWPKKPGPWRKSRSLNEAPSPCNCPCQQAPPGEIGGGKAVQEAVEATKVSSLDVFDGTDTIPSSNPPALQKTLTQKAIAKLSPIFKFVKQAGKKTLDVAKDQIKKYQPILLDLANKHGKVELKKYLEKQRAAATGGKQTLYEVALELLGGTNAPMLGGTNELLDGTNGDEKTPLTGAKVNRATDEWWDINNLVEA